MRIIISESQLKRIVSEQTTKKQKNVSIFVGTPPPDPNEQDKLFFSNELKKRGWHYKSDDTYHMVVENEDGYKNVEMEVKFFNDHAIFKQTLADDPYTEIKPWYLSYNCLKKYKRPLGYGLMECVKYYGWWGIRGRVPYNEPYTECFRPM